MALVNCYYTVFSSLLLLLLIAEPLQSVKLKTFIESLGLRNCSEPQKFPNYMDNVRVMQPTKGESFIMAEFVVKSPGSTSLKGFVELFKCSDRSGNECEPLIKWEVKDVCDAISKNDVVWTPMFNSSVPPHICPFRKATYRMDRMLPDVTKSDKWLQGIPFAKQFTWMGRLTVWKSKKPWTCYEYLCKINSVRI